MSWASFTELSGQAALDQYNELTSILIFSMLINIVRGPVAWFGPAGPLSETTGEWER
jgi:hypothetical protein